ncbi:MAG: NAD(P)-dependent oxidoreductase [Candidatus Krumholzibacteria bacterium]|nr:NAD(P)-dependent oxidoreductase [Candidatus Krumholzibacteria bacterium]
MNPNLPGVVVTGASGFIGRNFLASAAGKYRLFCLARRSRRDAGVPDYDNMRWTQVDISRWETMRDVVDCILTQGGADYVVHLAGYYDFHNMDNSEYDQTNVLGTRNVLKLARQIGTARFIFASSLAACEFPPPGEVLNEDSPPDAKFAYARSKCAGEEIVRDHTEYFPASVLRLAAVFSDWCEYPPLYMLMRTWLERGWNARILGGRGDSAVPYIHIQDLVKLIHRTIEQSEQLPRFGIYNISPSHVTSHRELFTAATTYYFGCTPDPICLPKWFAGIGVRLRWWLGRLIGRPPFEAPWMVNYIDKQLRVDASRSHAGLDWKPTERLDVQRRLLVMVENLKSHGEVWHMRNEEALQRIGQRPNLLISYELEELRSSLVEKISDYVTAPTNREDFCRYHEMPHETLLWFITLIYQVLVTSVRTRDRHMFRHYSQVIATRRKNEGFTADQVGNFLTTVGRLIKEELIARPALAEFGQQIHDYVTLSFQLAADGVDDVFEISDEEGMRIPAGYEGFDIPTTTEGLAKMVSRLEDTCVEAFPANPPGGSSRA